MITTISATELKNRVSEILDEVYFNGKTVVVERYGKPLVEILPIEKGAKKVEVKKALDATFGILPDFPDVTKFRVSRHRKIKL